MADVKSPIQESKASLDRFVGCIEYIQNSYQKVLICINYEFWTSKLRA